MLTTGRAEAQEEEIMGRIFHVLKCPVSDAEGNIVAIVGFDTDISDLRRAEQVLREYTETLEQRIKERTKELHESEQRFRDFADAASDWYWEMDAELRFTQISGKAFEATGRIPDEFIGKTRWEVYGASAEEPPWKEHWSVLETHQPFRDFCFSANQGDRGIKHYRLSGIPVFDQEDTFCGYRGVVTDETTKVESLSEAEQAQQRLLDAVEGFEDGFALFDFDDRLVLYNSQYAETVRCLRLGAVQKAS